MRMPRSLTGLAAVVLISLADAIGAIVLAQTPYPSRPVELIVPWGPGGGADQLARLISKQIEPSIDHGVPVVNVPGATGATGITKLLTSPADGYSMAVYIADSHALLSETSAAWSMNDITAVAVMLKAPSFLFVADKSRFKTWADFEREAKANPGKLKVATLGFGSVDDFTLGFLERKGIKVIQVPFSKPSERYLSILGEHADALYEQAGDVAQFLAAKQMRPLMVFGKERYPAFEDVPSSYELGYEVALPQFRSLVVKSGTPPEALHKLSESLAQIAATPEYKKFLRDQFALEDSFVGAADAQGYLATQLDDMKRAKN